MRRGKGGEGFDCSGRLEIWFWFWFGGMGMGMRMRAKPCSLSGLLQKKSGCTVRAVCIWRHDTALEDSYTLGTPCVRFYNTGWIISSYLQFESTFLCNGSCLSLVLPLKVRIPRVKSLISRLLFPRKT